MKKLLMISVVALTGLAHASDTKTVFLKRQPHNKAQYPYVNSKSADPTYLDNDLLIEQKTSQKTVNPKDMSQTQDRTFYVNCSTAQQKRNAAISEKFLNNFYTWEWADLLFQLDKNSQVYFQMVEGINSGDGKCPNMPLGAPCKEADGMFNGRLSYLKIVHFFKTAQNDDEYRLAVKKTECIGDDLVNISGHVNGSFVVRDPSQNGKAIRKIWYDTPVNWMFQINGKGKVAKEYIFVNKSFVPDLITRMGSDSSILKTPEHPFPEIQPEARQKFEQNIIEILNQKLKAAGEEPETEN